MILLSSSLKVSPKSHSRPSVSKKADSSGEGHQHKSLYFLLFVKWPTNNTHVVIPKPRVRASEVSYSSGSLSEFIYGVPCEIQI